MNDPSREIKDDLKKIGELSLNIIEKAKHQKLGQASGAKTYDQAIKINHLAKKIYKILDIH